MASEKITALIEEVKNLSVLELSELVKALEEEFGVSAAAMAAPSQGLIRRKRGKNISSPINKKPVTPDGPLQQRFRV